MKRIFSGLLYALIVTTAWGQSEPITTLQGDQGTKFGSPKLVTPNLQATKTAKGGRIETGNSNLLSNPSFEHTTYNTGWTCSLGSTTLETTAKTDGNQANAINSIGAGVRCYQTSTTNAANLKGLLGSAIVKIKTTDSIYKVCGLVDGNAAANERNCITVSPTSTDLPFYPARTDFYMGGTSNGIVIYTTTTTSQPTVIDDAFVGVFNGGISQFSQDTGWVSCTFSTLAWQGLGTVTNNLQCRRNGPKLEMRGNFVTGTTSANQAQIPIPTNYGSITTTSVSTGESLGSILRNTATNNVLNVIASNGSSFFNISNYVLSNSAVIAVNGNAAFNTGDAGVFQNVSINIAGWEANTNVAIAGCVDAFGCTNEVSAKISSTCAVSGENVDFINGNGVLSATSTCTFTLNTGLGLTNGMSCTASANASFPTTGLIIQFPTSSTTTIVTETRNDAGAASAQPYFLSCQKSGTDFKPKTVVVSPLTEYSKTTGGGNTRIISGRFGSGAGCMTACTAGTCTLCLQNGTDYSTVTFVGAGSYRINGIDGTKYACSGAGYSSTGPTVLYSANTSQNASYASVETINASSVNVNSFSVSFLCHGSNL